MLLDYLDRDDKYDLLVIASCQKTAWVQVEMDNDFKDVIMNCASIPHPFSYLFLAVGLPGLWHKYNSFITSEHRVEKRFASDSDVQELHCHEWDVIV